LFVLQRHYTVVPPSTSDTVLAIAATFIAAWLSWRYVERPFRGSRLPLTPLQLFAGAATVLALFIAAGAGAHLSHGFPSRYSSEVLAAGAVTREDLPLRTRCFQLSAQRYAAGDSCRFGPPDAPPDYMVWGDSHALMLMASIERLAKGRSGVLFGSTACPPLLGVDPSNRAQDQREQCMNGNAAALAALAAHPSIKTVILVARWSYYVEGTETALAARAPTLLTDAERTLGSSAHNHEVVERALLRTLEQIRASGRRVVTLETVPEMMVSVPDAMAQSAILARDIEFATSAADYRARQARTRALFERVRTSHPEFETITLADVLCNEQHCRVSDNGQTLYYDDNHLSPLGVSLIEGKLAAALGPWPASNANVP
jgi:hypothetical protein